MTTSKRKLGASDEGFAGRLRRARTDARMSQRDLERSSGIPKSRISRYENGHLLPSLGGLQKLSRSLGVADAELLGDEEDAYSVFTRALRRRGVTISSVREAEALAARIAEEITRPQADAARAAR